MDIQPRRSQPGQQPAQPRPAGQPPQRPMAPYGQPSGSVPIRSASPATQRPTAPYGGRPEPQPAMRPNPGMQRPMHPQPHHAQVAAQHSAAHPAAAISHPKPAKAKGGFWKALFWWLAVIFILAVLILAAFYVFMVR